jgi:hypothetical protein
MGGAERINGHNWAKQRIGRVDAAVLIGRLRELHWRGERLAGEMVREECAPSL